MVTDLTYLKNMADGNEDIVLDLIHIFIDQVDEFRDGMQKGLIEKDWQMLSKVAHKAKSSVAVMGMKDMADQLKNLELNSMNGINTEHYNEIVNDFFEACNEAVIELKKYSSNKNN